MPAEGWERDIQLIELAKDSPEVAVIAGIVRQAVHDSARGRTTQATEPKKLRAIRSAASEADVFLFRDCGYGLRRLLSVTHLDHAMDLEKFREKARKFEFTRGGPRRSKL